MPQITELEDHRIEENKRKGSFGSTLFFLTEEETETPHMRYFI